MMKRYGDRARLIGRTRADGRVAGVGSGQSLLARGLAIPAIGGRLIRDQALAVTDRLVESSGGPSVKPYHPARDSMSRLCLATRPSTLCAGPR